MKFLYVNKVFPGVGGGGEVRIMEIGRRLAKEGHKVYVVCGKTEADLMDFAELDKMEVFFVKTIPRYFFKFNFSYYLSRCMFYVLSFPKIYKVAKKNNVDLIIDNVSPAPSSAFLVSKLLGKPCYAIVHEFLGTQWFGKYPLIIAALGFLSQFLLFLNFDKIIVPSKYTKNLLKSFGLFQDKIVCVPNGIDISRYSCRRSSKEKNSLITIGRLVKYKGYSDIIAAIKKVAEHIPDVKLYIIGDGPLRKKLEDSAIYHALSKNIVFLGRVDEEEKINTLHKSEIFITYSSKEGFGISLLEAMASGLPTIASDIPAFREIIKNGKNGFLVQVGKPEKLAEKILYLLQDREKMNEISKNNLQHARKFSWDKIFEIEKRLMLRSRYG